MEEVIIEEIVIIILDPDIDLRQQPGKIIISVVMEIDQDTIKDMTHLRRVPIIILIIMNLRERQDL